MEAAVCTQKTLNPDAEEFKPTAIEKDVFPFLLHQTFHLPPPLPQGNELVVYQPPHYFHPPAVPSSFPHPHQFCYYQQNVPFYWIHEDFQPHHHQLLDKCEKTPQDRSFFDKDEIFSVGMKASFFSRSEKIRGQNKKPFLPPRLMMAAAAGRGRSKGFFLRKPHQATEDAGSISPYKSPLKKDTSFLCSNKTTVMIRNIPNQFRREPFMLFVDYYCRVNHWEYDFLYLPIDFGTKNNVGYAFVNFTSGCAASEIQKVLKNFKWHGVKTPTGVYSSSRKICEVTWARIQGKEQLVKHFSGSNFICDTDEYLPVVFSPPRNGSTTLTKPMTIGILAANSAVSSPPLPDDK